MGRTVDSSNLALLTKLCNIVQCSLVLFARVKQLRQDINML